jgi:putative Mn2+ efflux pump MntP
VLRILALTLPLALDTFAVSAALGVASPDRSRRLKLALTFTAFEALMPLVGLALGAPLGRAIGSAADYIAFALLLALGAYMLVGDKGEEERFQGSATGRLSLLVLGLSVSLDELAIGFTFGLLRLPVIPALIVIAVQAFVAAQLGLWLGARFGESIREGSERLAGVALITLGLALLALKVF